MAGEQDDDVETRRRRGGALVLLGALACLRAWAEARPPPPLARFGEPVALDVARLAGEEFRLLPGAGPVLAGRLEQARVAAGGSLSLDAAGRVPGVGPALRARWEALSPDARGVR